MGSLLHVASHDFIPKVTGDFVVEVALDDAVGVYDNECGPDISKDLIFSVAVDDVSEDLGLVEYVHFAHICVQLALGHFVGVLIFGGDGEFAFGSVGLVLHLVVIEGLFRGSPKKGNR